MYVKELMLICFLLIVQYAILFFNLFDVYVVIFLMVGMIPSYFLFQKVLKKASKKEYLLDAYIHDIKILGLYVLLFIIVFILLYIQEAFLVESAFIQSVFSLGLSLFIYCFIYLDFLRKKISAYHEYNEVQQGLMKACMALLFFLLYNIVYFGRW
jgi:hypothetical protein